MSATSPFRTDGDKSYRWPPEPAEIEKEYVRVTKLINAGEPQPWMKPWVSKLIAEEAMSNGFAIFDPLKASIGMNATFYVGEWWQEQLEDAKEYDARHVQRGEESGRNNKAWKHASLVAMSYEERLKKYLKETPDRKRDAAANKGTAVHKLAEDIEKGLSVIVPEELKPYVDNFRKFRKDFPINYTEIEATVYSDAYGYAGQCDAFAEYEGKQIILDYKTGATGIKESIALQLAAYAGADFIGRADGTKDKMPDFDEFWGVSIRNDGYDVVPVNVTSETWNYFLAVRETALWMAQKKSDVLGKPLKPLVAA